jgi:HD-like signal output (HDOD) protein
LEAGALWDASLITAAALEQLCRSSTTDPNVGYVVGLLHAVGKLPLNDFVVQMDFRPMPDLSNPENSVRLEIALLGHNFGEVGAALLKSWGFPELITEAIARQCTPELAGDQMDFVLRLKLAASWAAELMARESGDVETEGGTEDSDLMEQVGVDAATADEIKQKARRLWQDARAAG